MHARTDTNDLSHQLDTRATSCQPRAQVSRLRALLLAALLALMGTNLTR